MIDKIGGRKVVVSVIAIVVGIGLVLIKGDIPSNMLVLIMSVVGAFVGGNAIEHITDAQIEKQQALASQPIGVNPEALQMVGAAIDNINKNLEEHRQAIAVTQDGLEKVIKAVSGK